MIYISNEQLKTAMSAVVPTDAQFQAEFATAKVSKSHLARYYLRALETEFRDEPEPEFIPNEDQSSITLEHVLPQNPGPGWAAIQPEVAAAYYKRLGNLVLLKAKTNSNIGNRPFSQKKAELAASTYKLTESVGK